MDRDDDIFIDLSNEQTVALIKHSWRDYVRSKKENPRWGVWVYNSALCTLAFDDYYKIDLEKIDSSAEILDRIFQIHNKLWATPQIIHDLLSAFDDLLNPQKVYCPSGVSKTHKSLDAIADFFSVVDNS